MIIFSRNILWAIFFSRYFNPAIFLIIGIQQLSMVIVGLGYGTAKCWFGCVRFHMNIGDYGQGKNFTKFLYITQFLLVYSWWIIKGFTFQHDNDPKHSCKLCKYKKKTATRSRVQIYPPLSYCGMNWVEKFGREALLRNYH
jgi:hypothetical protein